jgi:hypothetical protein
LQIDRVDWHEFVIPQNIKNITNERVYNYNFKTMKTVKLILASALVIGAVAVNAQDSTNVTPQPQLEQPAPQQQDPAQQPEMDYKKDMVVVPAAEIPASLRSTLQGSEYKGWESGTIYRNQASDMFIVETREGDKTTIHRFDKDGNAIKD